MVQAGGCGNLGISDASRLGLRSGSLGLTVAEERMVGGGTCPICGMGVASSSMMRWDSAPISDVRLLTKAKVSIREHFCSLSWGVDCKTPNYWLSIGLVYCWRILNSFFLTSALFSSVRPKVSIWYMLKCGSVFG